MEDKGNNQGTVQRKKLTLQRKVEVIDSRAREMEKRTGNAFFKEKANRLVEVTFADGSKLVGKLIGFSTYELIIQVGTVEHLVFKHAIRSLSSAVASA